MPLAGGACLGYAAAGRSDVYLMLSERLVPFVVYSRSTAPLPLLAAGLGALLVLALWRRALRKRRDPLAATLAASPLLLFSLWFLHPRPLGYQYLPLLYLASTSLWPVPVVAAALAIRVWWPDRAAPGGRPYSLRQWWPPAYAPLLRRGGLGLGILVFAVLAAVTPRWTRWQLSGGDEPHYLMIAHSLLHDRDLDVANQYQDEVGKRWTPFPMHPHKIRDTRRGGMLSVHSPGLPFLILPGFALGGALAGASGERIGAVLTQHLATALLVVVLFRLTRRLTRSPRASRLAVAILLLALPWPLYTFTVYTEIPAAVLVLFALERILAPSPPRGWTLAALICFLPWLHVKYVTLALGLSGLLLWRVVRSRGLRRAAILAIWVGVLGQTVPLFHFWGYGDYGFLAAYGGRLPTETSLVPLWMAGQLVDRQFGLFLYAPFTLLGTGRLLGWAWRGRGLAFYLLGVMGAHWLAASTIWYWWGGGPYPNRLLLPLVPVLAAAFAFPACLSSLRRRPAFVRPLVGALSGLLLVLALPHPLQLTHRLPGTSAFFLELRAADINLSDYFPSFIPVGDTTLSHLLLLGATAALVAAAGTLAARSRRGLAPLAGAVLVIAAVGAYGAVVRARFLPLPRFDDPCLRPRDNLDANRFLDRVEAGGYAFATLAPAELVGAAPPPPFVRLTLSDRSSGGHPISDDRLHDRLTLVRGGEAVVFRLKRAVPAGHAVAALSFRVRAAAEEIRLRLSSEGLSAPLAELALGASHETDDYKVVQLPVELPAAVPSLDFEVAVTGSRRAGVHVYWVGIAAAGVTGGDGHWQAAAGSGRPTG